MPSHGNMCARCDRGHRLCSSARRTKSREISLRCGKFSESRKSRSIGERVAFITDVIIVTSTRHGALSPGDDRPMVMRMAAVGRLLLVRGRQALCGLRGHDMMLHFEPNRLSLRCLACGAETPGWRLDVSPHLRSHRPRVVVSTMRADDVGSRPSRNRHESGASSPAPTAA
jgi:hypothetical protein